MSADDPICLSVIGADGVPAGLDETDPGELARTEETARRWDISGYEDGDAERIEQAQEPSRLRAEIGRLRWPGKGGIAPLSKWCEVQWPPADMEYAPNPALSTATTDRADETVLLHATPTLRARIESLGYRPGEAPAGMLPWLVGQAELWRAALVDAEDRLEAAGLDEGEP